MPDFRYIGNKRWIKVMQTIAGLILMALLLLIFFSYLVIWGLGIAREESEKQKMEQVYDNGNRK